MTAAVLKSRPSWARGSPTTRTMEDFAVSRASRSTARSAPATSVERLKKRSEAV